jgi:hypothetical protein
MSNRRRRAARFTRVRRARRVPSGSEENGDGYRNPAISNKGEQKFGHRFLHHSHDFNLALQLPFCFEVRTLSGGLVSSTPE